MTSLPTSTAEQVRLFVNGQSPYGLGGLRKCQKILYYFMSLLLFDISYCIYVVKLKILRAFLCTRPLLVLHFPLDNHTKPKGESDFFFTQSRSFRYETACGTALSMVTSLQ